LRQHDGHRARHRDVPEAIHPRPQPLHEPADHHRGFGSMQLVHMNERTDSQMPIVAAADREVLRNR
jgi:hypothetical protein